MILFRALLKLSTPPPPEKHGPEQYRANAILLPGHPDTVPGTDDVLKA